MSHVTLSGLKVRPRLHSKWIGEAKVSEAKAKSFQQCVLDYERCLISRGNTDLMKATLTMVDGVSKACSEGGFVEKGVATVHREHWYTRAAAALSRFITDPDTRLKQDDLSPLSMRKQAFVYIFCASGFRNMAHLTDLLKDVKSDGSETIDVARAAVLLFFIGLDDLSDGLMDVALQQPPPILYHLSLGWLNQRAVLTAQGEKNRGRLLASGHLLMSATITDKDIGSLSSAWMYCSYASLPSKHDIKDCFNHLLSKRMVEVGIAAAPVTHTTKQRPKVLVIHERFVEQHAMFRCYAPLMRSLKPYFETVALADATMIDEASNALFDKVLALQAPLPSVKDIVSIIKSENPDIIYYPSLGMSPWTIMLAGLRLAPLQVMTQGHPATSKLNTIDFVYLHGLQGDPSQVYTEGVIIGPPELTFEQHSGLRDDLPDLLLPSTREVNIAVNSKVMKLSWRLLEVCRRLEREASVPINFTFFPGERFLYGDGLEAAIRSQLPSGSGK